VVAQLRRARVWRKWIAQARCQRPGSRDNLLKGEKRRASTGRKKDSAKRSGIDRRDVLGIVGTGAREGF
jgi:hypothetical protein